MLKQSGNTVDKGVSLFWLKYKQENGHKVLVLKLQIQEMAQEFKHCVFKKQYAVKGHVPLISVLPESESFTSLIEHAKGSGSCPC